MMTKKRKIIAIVGPTATGKTGIGVRLAKEFNGEIVSADSRQVYRGLDLGTGKEGEPCEAGQIAQLLNCSIAKGDKQQSNNETIEQLRHSIRRIDAVDQWMIDVANSEEKFTLFDYLPLTRAAIEDIFSRGKTPIIVGGTGLYIQALTEGFELQQNTEYSPPKMAEQNSAAVILNESEESIMIDPSSPPLAGAQDDTKKYSREQLENLTIDQLNDILRGIDPEKSEKVDRKNRHRLERAIELAQDGLKPIKVKPDFEVLQIALDLPRQELFDRIDRRVDERFQAGMLEEVVNLIKSGVSPDWLQSLGLEYREITDFVISKSEIRNPKQIQNEKFSNDEINDQCKMENGQSLTFDEMSQKLKFRIHQFARRQTTWFRRFPAINWLRDYKDIKRFAKIFLDH